MKKKPFLSNLDKIKAGLELTGKTIKTGLKRAVGDESGEELSPNAEAFTAGVTKDSK